ncbi:ERCC4 domain-containing protein [Fundidesulfovibrio terrae]|uniref:ERCC4 domain-containing protein n=1 Tax=Fundidesulfovibrio terrae TaxID=2922866 RepID=UPI001FAFB4FE|nr:ERCC4 domain-containing protein [Fundidesulfovibrio terrae]
MGSSFPYVPLRIVVDTREQHPYAFEKYPEAEIIRHGLKTGDYSLAGYEDRMALERKSLDDLIGCLTTGRDRFERELERARALDLFAVIVEASVEDVKRGRYRSKLNPHAALQSVIAFQVRYGTSFVWAGSRAGGEYMAYGLLEKYRREKEGHGEALAASGTEGASKRTRAARRERMDN